MQNIAAIYEHGLLRLLEPLPLSDGTEVRLSVFETYASSSRVAEMPTEPRQTPAQILAEIAAIAEHHGGVETAGRDHDLYLYGWDRSK